MSNFIQEFKEKVNKRQTKIAVIGLGYVGLPLALEFAKKDFSVLGIDVDKDRIERIIKKESYITDISNSELEDIINKGKFNVTNNFLLLNKADVVFICVPTPLKRKYHPDISFIKNAVKTLSKNIKNGSKTGLQKSPTGFLSST